MRRLNPTLLALLGGVAALLLIIAYFASNRSSDQDKLSGNLFGNAVTQAAPPPAEKRCSSKATYDLIKREIFRHAAQLRGSDQAAYDRLATYAVLRVENPVLESENKDTRAVNCSGSVALDLPPGVAVVGGRRTLTADVDYTVQPAADGSGDVVLLRNADAIVAPLATLARTGAPAVPPEGQAPPALQPVPIPAPAPGSPSVPAEPAPPPPSQPPVRPRPRAARPSFDCAKARTRSEVAVCSDAGLAALDRNMAAQFGRAFALASPQQRDLLRQTAHRFYAFRDRCSNRTCIADAYLGRMREIGDIVEGRWRGQQ